METTTNINSLNTGNNASKIVVDVPSLFDKKKNLYLVRKKELDDEIKFMSFRIGLAKTFLKEKDITPERHQAALDAIGKFKVDRSFLLRRRADLKLTFDGLN